MRDRYKKIATGTSTEEISSLAKKLIDKGQVWQPADLDTIKEIVLKFNSEMNIYESKFNHNDNMSIVSSISMVATNHETKSIENRSIGQRSNAPKSVNHSRTQMDKHSGMIRELSTDSFDINVKMNFEHKNEHHFKIDSVETNINSVDLLEHRVNSHILPELILDRKDSRISVQSGSSVQSYGDRGSNRSNQSHNSHTNQISNSQFGFSGYSDVENLEFEQKNKNVNLNKNLNKNKISNKRELESIEQEIKLQRKQLIELKKCNQDLISEKEELLKETHGLG